MTDEVLILLLCRRSSVGIGMVTEVKEVDRAFFGDKKQII